MLEEWWQVVVLTSLYFVPTALKWIALLFFAILSISPICDAQEIEQVVLGRFETIEEAADLTENHEENTEGEYGISSTPTAASLVRIFNISKMITSQINVTVNGKNWKSYLISPNEVRGYRDKRAERPIYVQVFFGANLIFEGYLRPNFYYPCVPPGQIKMTLCILSG